MTATKRVMLVVGTRPNFMKIAPIVRALEARPVFETVLVHTGQHYDDAMSQVFLDELGVGEPDRFLDVGSGSHSEQVARVMERLEPLLHELAPDLVLVPGDVNSTLAAALTAAKAVIPVGHVEAGLRSFDRTMPEEVNRVVADALSDLLFTHSPEARDNLRAEARPEQAIRFVGNTMIDTLVRWRDRIEPGAAARAHGVEPGGYLLVTLHRPALVDGPLLDAAMDALEAAADELEVVFPVHPRTAKRLDEIGWTAPERIRLLDPLPYSDFLGLLSSAAATLTDSGGIQEEATFLGIPCFTLRDNTERPVTISEGTNVLLGLDPARIAEVPALAAEQRGREARIPALWDGRAGARIADELAAWTPSAPVGASSIASR